MQLSIPAGRTQPHHTGHDHVTDRTGDNININIVCTQAALSFPSITPLPASMHTMKRNGRSSFHSGKSLKAENLPASTTKRRIRASSSASSVHNKTTEPNGGDNNPSQLLDHAPESLEHQGDQITHADNYQTRDCAVGRGEIVPVDNFHDEYLRKCKDCRKNKSDIYWNKFKEDLGGCKVESDMYSIIVKSLTEICIAVCKPRTLLFATDIACFTDILCR